MLKRMAIYLGGLVIAVSLIWIIFLFAPTQSVGKTISLKLNRDVLTVLEFPSQKSVTTALILFLSGDGGWGDLEEGIAHALQKHGYEIIGIDSVQYAKTDYNLDILQADFSTIAQAAELPFDGHPRPLIVGGYSMGAEQAIAVAGGPSPPPGLVGLLLVDPCSRGRYGLRTSDQMNVLPTGPGTFSMEDFAQTMGKLRVVQWHASQDEIDSRTWLDSLTAKHQEFDFPNAGHDYGNNRDDFLHQLVQSASWILSSDPGAPRAVINKN